MKKKTIWLSALLIVILAAGAVGYRVYASTKASTTSSTQTATVQSGSLTTTLSSSGNTRSGQNTTIAWKTSGKVGDLAVQVGDVVTADQVLATLDATSLSTDMITAKQTLLDAKQALDDLVNSKTSQATALQTLEDAQKTVDDLKQSVAQEAATAQQTLATAQAALTDAQKARAAMDYPKTSDPLVVEKAQTEYLMAKNTYKDALKEYQKVAYKKLTDPQRAQALDRLVAAEQAMNTAFATYNYYLLPYTDQNIAEADAAVAVAQADVNTAQSNYDSLKNGPTAAAMAVAQAKLDDAQRAYDLVKNGPTADQIAAAQAAVDAAQATLDQAQLLAPFGGTVTEVDIKTGDMVNSGTAAFRIDDLGSIYIDLQISEVDLASLKVGQQATLAFDAIASKEYAGEVISIGMVGTVSNGVVNYPVVVKITNPDSDIKPGMTASVTIITDQVDDVLVVPNKAIHTTNGQKTVTVLFEGQQITVPVTVGLTNSSMSEVTSSQLKEGDTVVVSGTTSSTSTTTTTNSNRQNNDFGGGPTFGGPPPGG
jgi:HlyD family secretion protein